jgi:arylsulfatase A-like enzyme
MFDLSPRVKTLFLSLFPSWFRERQIDSTDMLTRSAITFLRHYRREQFFLWVHLFDPHGPYDPPRRYRTGLARDAAGPWREYPPRPAPSDDELANIPFDRQQMARDLYRGEIAYVDRAVGKILDELDRLELTEDTIVVFTSDHGEEMYDHGKRGHGFSLYEELLHIPLVLAGPGIASGRKETPVSTIHLIPTLADFMGIGPQPDWSGQSLRAVLRGDDAADVPAYCFASGTDWKTYPQEAVIAGERKLIRAVGSDERQYYDLAGDPREQSDLSDQAVEEVTDLTTVLDAWTRQFPRTFADAEELGLMRTKANETSREELEDALRNLGYLN